MDKQHSSSMTAVKLRIVLLCTAGLLLAIFAAGFLFFRNQLDVFATQVKADNNAAAISNNDVERLQDLKQKLENDKVAVNRAKNIVADSQYYQYQNQIISDINQYANDSGVTITSFTFSSGNDKKTAAPVPSTLTTPPPGLKSTSAVIAIKSPVNYDSIMRFIHSIELNLTKMQLAGVSLTKGTSNTDVTVNPITLEVYTR